MNPTPIKTLDSRDFRAAMGEYATGVTVVAADGPHGLAAITVNSFTSVSLDPPLILWCAGKGGSRAETFRAAPVFGVSVLTADQEALAARFAARADFSWDEGVFDRGLDGAPMVAGAAARFSCALSKVHSGGDHWIILAEVRAVEIQTGAPALTFHRGRFGQIATSPRA